ncbi:TPR-like protein [Trematosphaeria pertusa]|uniref:TPR-like protein n=1 Tax=Trematosphaeria pertusa TaxID=390896 RepID=A0A6A6IIG9_9PLEO|nr:TPR-like protein [Trematosphaeria pertusa]KAF2249838.1 TPR-like protein [Trematosphaeria pertusa]
MSTVGLMLGAKIQLAPGRGHHRCILLYCDSIMTSTISFGDANAGFQAGVIHGDVHHHPPHERPETPPSPSAHIPFRRDANFVDRGTLLDQIRQQCSAPASRVALVGLGGVGKSQLAIEHCYRTAEQSPETWVFWAHASNAARLVQSFRDIADQAKVRGRNDLRADVFKLVHDWLRDEKHGKWLLVVDNADDADVLSQLPSSSKDASLHDLSSYLPPSRHGSVLVTSRTKQAASRLVEKSDIIQIEPMDDAGARALLNKKLGDTVNKDGMADLAAALEYMPLALVQAAAYIQKRAPRCSVRQYLEEFEKSDKKKTSLLDYEAGNLRRDGEARNSIIITWQISFDHIRSARQSAADLLSLMSFFDRQGIPEALLRGQGGTGEGHARLRTDEKSDEESEEEDSASEDSIDDGFEDDVSTLRDYCFISVAADVATFEMHRLVQLATQKWLKGQGQLERWKQQFIANLCAEFPTGHYENWGKCQTLLPHAASALAQKPKNEESLMKWALLLYNAAWYVWQRGSVGEVEEMSTRSMKARIRLFGKESAETLSSMAMLGLAKTLKGQWKEAEELEVQVMETSKRVLGEEHPDTLISMGNLASTYWNQGRRKEAEELEVQVIEARKRVLGEEHPHTLISMGNLALTYWNQGRWKEAEELGVQVMETFKRVLGEEHPHTLASMGNLALTYWNQGQWKKAEELEVQVIETRKRVLREEHPDTLASMGNLALTYRNQGQRKKAEELDVQVIEARKRVLGEEHPDTLISMGNLALTYWNQGRWKEAEELGVQVIEARKRVLGEEHPHTLASMGNLASTYRNQGRWKEAEELGVQVMETFKRVLGEEHPDTLMATGNLAFTLKSQSHNKEAISLMEACFQQRKQILGDHHPDTESSLEALNKWQMEDMKIGH